MKVLERLKQINANKRWLKKINAQEFMKNMCNNPSKQTMNELIVIYKQNYCEVPSKFCTNANCSTHVVMTVI